MPPSIVVHRFALQALADPYSFGVASRALRQQWPQQFCRVWHCRRTRVSKALQPDHGARVARRIPKYADSISVEELTRHFLPAGFGIAEPVSRPRALLLWSACLVGRQSVDTATTQPGRSLSISTIGLAIAAEARSGICKVRAADGSRLFPPSLRRWGIGVPTSVSKKSVCRLTGVLCTELLDDGHMELTP